MEDSRTPRELEELVYGDGEPVDLGEPAPKPPDIGRAGWHLRKAQTIRAQSERDLAVFDSEIERITERRAEVADRNDRAALWHENAVEAWHRASFAAGDVGKTVKLPTGESQLRASQPSTEIYDEDALRACRPSR